MTRESPTDSNPATLVAICVAARTAKNRELEREMRRILEERHGVRLSFTVNRKVTEVSHAK